MGLKSWKYDLFQSRNRDTFLFKRVIGICTGEHTERVSISQSRYFSFQVDTVFLECRINLVSISQSRYFSFQDRRYAVSSASGSGFNLAIEILFFSSYALRKALSPGLSSFNLAIEILFFSRGDLIGFLAFRATFQVVSISQSRYFSFQEFVSFL